MSDSDFKWPSLPSKTIAGQRREDLLVERWLKVFSGKVFKMKFSGTPDLLYRIDHLGSYHGIWGVMLAVVKQDGKNWVRHNHLTIGELKYAAHDFKEQQ